jgi:hypothetical protein
MSLIQLLRSIRPPRLVQPVGQDAGQGQDQAEAQAQFQFTLMLPNQLFIKFLQERSAS